VLLPDVALLRRQDEVAAIGSAIEAKVAGEGHRPIARRLGVHADTVRGWLRRFAERAERIRAHFTRWAVALDPELGPVLPAGSAVGDALEAIAVAARAWVLRFGPGDPWRIASVLSAGAALDRHRRPLSDLLLHPSMPTPSSTGMSKLNGAQQTGGKRGPSWPVLTHPTKARPDVPTLAIRLLSRDIELGTRRGGIRTPDGPKGPYRFSRPAWRGTWPRGFAGISQIQMWLWGSRWGSRSSRDAISGAESDCANSAYGAVEIDGAARSAVT